MRKYLMILFIAMSILTANSQNVRTVHLDGQSLEEILGIYCQLTLLPLQVR